jgi:undecaprenyl-diphosphatase
MSILEAIVLGGVQGLTEFIPVSSSGHLIITHALLGTGSNFEFDVLLNVGTLAALLVYFWDKLKQIIQDVMQQKKWQPPAVLALATIPALVIGYIFAGTFQNLGDHVLVVIAMLIAVGYIMTRFDGSSQPTRQRELSQVRPRQAVMIGLAQATALVPGVSRSGATILAGLSQRFSPKLAAEFSFLLAIPTILGAVLKVLFSNEGRGFITDEPLAFIIGNIFSFAAGMFAIGFLIRVLVSKGLRDFGYYRIYFGLFLLLLWLVGII